MSGNNPTHQQDHKQMKNNKTPTLVEDNSNPTDLTEKRKTSASVDEIRDLFSALQELVPSTNQPSSPVPSLEKAETRNVGSEENSNVSQSCSRQNLAPLIQPKRSTSPLPSRTQPKVELRRDRSNSLDAQLGFPNCEEVLRRDSMCGYSQRKRFLKKTQRIELHNIIKDFDETETNDSRFKSRSLNTLMETTGPSEDVPARPKSFTEICEEPTICKTEEESTNAVERPRSYTYVESEDQSTHVLVARQRSFTDGCEEMDGRILENANHKLQKNEVQDSVSENADNINYTSPRKRLSAGDIYERQRAKLNDPRALYRRRSIGGSLLLSAIVSSASTSPTKRRGSLASALSLIAHKNELQELMKNCQDKLSKEENNNEISDETDYANKNTEAPKTKPTQMFNNHCLQKEINILLASIKELQQDAGNFECDQDSCEDFNSSRRGSAASTGTEMHNLLEALRELMECVGEDTPSSTPSGSTTSSRRTSMSDGIRAGAQRESLQELEAYFKSKLEDISEGGSSSVDQSKTSKRRESPSNRNRTQDDLARNNRNSAAKETAKDKTYRTKSQGLETVLPPTRKSTDLLKPNNTSQTTGQHAKSPPIRSRRRSRSAHDIHLPERTERMLANETRINRSPSHSCCSRRHKTGSNVNIDPLQPQSRASWKEDQLMFADQVNKRLQDWLERATALSLQEDQETKLHHTLKVDTLLVPSSDNERVECKTKKTSSRSAMKKLLRKKIRRSKSVNNLSEPEPELKQKSPKFKRGNRKKVKRSKSLHSIHDHDESQQTKPKRKPYILRSPQSLLRIGRQRLLRSKSFHNVSTKSPCDSLERGTAESDGSFDDGNSPFCQNLSCDSSEQNQSFDSLDADSDNQVTITRCSYPQKTGQTLINIQTPNKTEKNLRLNKKRISRFPVNLPLFYTPGSAAPTLQTTNKDERCSQDLKGNKRRSERKSLLLNKTEPSHGLFYEESRATNSQVTHAFPVQSKETNMWRPCSMSDEGYVRSPNQEGPYDSSSPYPTFADLTDDEFRDRARSTESEDSGCPIIMDV